MSLLTMIMNRERAKDFSDMMSKLNSCHALIRDYEMKFDKNERAQRHSGVNTLRWETNGMVRRKDRMQW